MKRIWMPAILVTIILAAGSAAAGSPPPPAPGGAFESLSPGNQKIALAIFDSGLRTTPPTATGPLSLDQIAQMKQGGKGWGVVFKEMKSQGLVQDRNLGQAVSRVSRGGREATAARTEISTASGKTAIVGGPAIAGGKETASMAISHGRDGSVGASAARGAGESHGGGRGK